MNLLALDSSSENISLSIMHKDKILVDFNRRMNLGASRLLFYLDKYFKEFSLSLERFDAFVVGSGPGSFTGLRISFSIIKGFALALGKPVISIGSFLSLAYPFRKQRCKIAVISDARRNLIYGASFAIKNGIFKKEAIEGLTTVEKFIKNKNDYFFVTYDEALRNKIMNSYSGLEFCPENVYPRAEYLLELAQSRYIDKDFTPIDKLEPLYLHPKTCQIK
ncbi:MAG: tRNA (adenosine(37)-N6)-threonylcarbamoyltransferase complex dimerization subunit type 1 TsaB [Candidatus Omnitrophota bacterium]|nr:tRNA (adenosine(37)-N6)-threonylcarbamoyltransferase complex dimerization subunit type 1 TsaB [Candidatus Omnitrophota bacterium]